LAERRGVLLLLLGAVPGWAGCAAVRQPTPAACVCASDLEAQPAPPGERYYCLVFSAESVPKLPRYTHTWVTAVRATPGRPGCPPELDAQTISWLPASLRIEPFDLCVERGVNLDLHATLRLMQAQGMCVSLWGPFEMRPGVYRKFLMQKRFVESGRLAFQSIDVVGEAGWTGAGSNCIHAVTDADPAFGPGPTLAFGDDAGSVMAAHLAGSGALVCPGRTHDWLLAALGLGGYPIGRPTARVPAGRCGA
jgi:hypothetical protein